MPARVCCIRTRTAWIKRNWNVVIYIFIFYLKDASFDTISRVVVDAINNSCTNCKKTLSSARLVNFPFRNYENFFFCTCIANMLQYSSKKKLNPFALSVPVFFFNKFIHEKKLRCNCDVTKNMKKKRIMTHTCARHVAINVVIHLVLECAQLKIARWKMFSVVRRRDDAKHSVRFCYFFGQNYVTF